MKLLPPHELALVCTGKFIVQRSHDPFVRIIPRGSIASGVKGEEEGISPNRAKRSLNFIKTGEESSFRLTSSLDRL